MCVLYVCHCSGGSATSVDANGVSGNYGGAAGGSIWIECDTAKIAGNKLNLVDGEPF